MDFKNVTTHLMKGIPLFLGLFFLGLFVYKGLTTFSDKDRIVTVKGLAQIDVNASSATITIDFNFSGDSLKSIIKKSDTKKRAIIDYLSSIGYDTTTIDVKKISIDDKQDYYVMEWVNEKEVKKKVDRYSTTQEITFDSKRVQTTEETAAEIKLDLINKDLTSNIKTEYRFPELNIFKPKLIEESTENARITGMQFAKDSKSTLGKIKTASQGQIEESTYYNQPYTKNARVVSSIVFFLE